MGGFWVRKYIKKYKFNSTFIHNFIIIFAVIVIPVVMMCSIIYDESKKTLGIECKQMMTERREKIEQVSNDFFKAIDMMMWSLLNENSTNNIFIQKKEKMELADSYNELMKIEKSLKQSHVFIKDIYVYSDVNRCLVTADSCTDGMKFEEQQWYDYYDNEGANPIVFSGGMVHNSNDEITIMHRYTLNNGERLGMAAITVSANEYFKSLGLNIRENREILVIPIDNVCAISTCSDLLNSDINSKIRFFSEDGIDKAEFDGVEYACVEAKSCYSDWRYIYLSPDLIYQLSGKNMVNLSVGMIIVSLIVSILVALYVSLKSFKPLDDIIGYIYNEKDFAEAKPKEKNNELSYIHKSIRGMVSNNTKLNEKLKKTLLLLNETQICSLQHQINPHFMYNTLEVIKWMAFDYKENRQTVVPMLEKLANVVHYSIDMRSYVSYLYDEIDMTKSYVDILKCRYENRLDVQWEISDEHKNIRVLKLCLQPLIENSVYHGFKKRKKGGMVWIKTDLADDVFSITVRDNGCGMTQEELDCLREKLDKTEIMSESSVGLSNLNLRIKLICGEQFGLRVYSTLGEGTTVVMTMSRESFL